MSQEGLKPVKGGSSSTGVEIDNGALVIDGDPNKVSAVDSSLSENYSETDALEKGKGTEKPQNFYQRYGKRIIA